ncbi:MAG TPA: PASTA domain-containing protein [Actinomycetota bacterium]|jgi:serine/threonine-protein kinase|nr:PASTA domain-containing protein [Actinomycetota bacterium]
MDRLIALVKQIPPGPVVAAAAIALLAAMATQPGSLAHVPEVTGASVQAAQARAAAAGFTTRVVLKSGPGAAGTVLGQQPASGTLAARRSAVVLFVTKGARQVGVPDVRGMPVAEARRVLAQAELTPGDVTYKPTRRAEPNRVYATDPPPGATVDVGTSVHVFAAT